MFFGTKTVDVIEFSSAATRVVNKGLKLTPLVLAMPWMPVSFGPLRLVGEWVKSVHANDLPSFMDDAWAKLEATSTCQRLTAPTLPHTGTNLRLRERLVGELDGIRDFSKSTRIGEYGQAVCLIFVQDKLHYPIVFDFDIFCSLAGVGVIPKTDSKPDFVGWDGEQFVLVESKASLGSDAIKTTLREGLLQCDAGSTHLAAAGFVPAASYCVLTTFQMDTVGKNSCVNFADPEGEPSTPDGTHMRVVNAYYRNALQALGCFGTEIFRLSGDAFGGSRTFSGMGDRTFFKLRYFEKPLWIEDMSPELGLYGGNYSLWMDGQILDALRSGNGRSFKQKTQAFYEVVDQFEGSANVNSEQFIQVFRDGLVMVLERPDAFPTQG
ncbi:MAG TPA: hypothetical protein VIM63_16505 [Rhodoferax sp.]